MQDQENSDEIEISFEESDKIKLTKLLLKQGGYSIDECEQALDLAIKRRTRGVIWELVKAGGMVVAGGAAAGRAKQYAASLGDKKLFDEIERARYKLKAGIVGVLQPHFDEQSWKLTSELSEPHFSGLVVDYVLGEG